jgi:hypothetical protein
MLAGVALFPSACAKLDGNSHRAQTQTSTSESDQHVTPPLNPHRYGGGTNYFVNPSFETQVTPWRPWNPNSVVQITRATRKIGRASAHVSAKSGAPYGIYNPNVVNLPAQGDRFFFSVWLRSGDRPKKLSVLLQGGGPNGRLTEFARSDPTITSGSWRHVLIGGRVKRRNITGIDSYVVVLNSIGTGDSFFIDGTLLVRQ